MRNNKDMLKHYLKSSSTSENKQNLEGNCGQKKMTINKVSVTLGSTIKKFANQENSLMQGYTETNKQMPITHYSLRKSTVLYFYC